MMRRLSQSLGSKPPLRPKSSVSNQWGVPHWSKRPTALVNFAEALQAAACARCAQLCMLLTLEVQVVGAVLIVLRVRVGAHGACGVSCTAAGAEALLPSRGEHRKPPQRCRCRSCGPAAAQRASPAPPGPCLRALATSWEPWAPWLAELSAGSLLLLPRAHLAPPASHDRDGALQVHSRAVPVPGRGWQAPDRLAESPGACPGASSTPQLAPDLRLDAHSLPALCGPLT